MPRISQKLKETAQELRKEARLIGADFKEVFGIGNLRGAQACAASPQVTRKERASEFSDVRGEIEAPSVKLPQIVGIAQQEVQKPCKHLQYQTTVDDKMSSLYGLIARTPEHPGVRSEVILAKWVWMERTRDCLRDADDATFAQLGSDLYECTDTYEAFKILCRFYDIHFAEHKHKRKKDLDTLTASDKQELMRFLAACLKCVWTARTLAQIPYPVTHTVLSAVRAAIKLHSPINQFSEQLARSIKVAKQLPSPIASDDLLDIVGHEISCEIDDIGNEFYALLLCPGFKDFLSEQSDRFENVLAIAVAMDDPIQAYAYIKGGIEQVMPAIPSAPPLETPKVPTPPKEEAPAVAHPRHHRVKKKVAATLPELKPLDLRGTRFKLLPPIGSAQVEQTKQGEKDAH